ncbi:hypothetical protein [Rhizobium aegyptiacum]|uniref:hypothetical protein n=1 Tax=Rhizobium aegyptiacum TaxID=1764550 RepID=UPI0012E7EAEC|nr:hypothetical protein [Rhizobium aegyptiacum]
MRVVINSSSRRFSVPEACTVFTKSTTDTDRSTIDVAVRRAWVKMLRPFFVGWNNAARQKKFLPFRNFFIKAALIAH